MRHHLAVIAMMLSSAASIPAQDLAHSAPPPDYVVGGQDVLLITSYDQAELTGKFVVETDGTFTFPMIGRVAAGGLTLREIEASLKEQLVAGGLFVNPQITVTVTDYRSQKIFILGEVRSPGAYAMTGGMRLVEALARAGSTLPTAGEEAVIMRAGDQSGMSAAPQVRVNLRQLENGTTFENVALRDGDTIFVPRAEPIYVFGQVRNPGAYPLRQKGTTVLQALALAGGVTDRGATGRIRVVRVVDGERQERDAELTDDVRPLDTVVVPERFF